MRDAAVCPPVFTLTSTDDDLETALAVNVPAPHVLTAGTCTGPGSLSTEREFPAHGC